MCAPSAPPIHPEISREQSLLRRALVALSAIAVGATSVAAQSAATSATPPTDKLQPLAFLAGHCWKGTFPNRTVTDEHCFEWVYGGKFLRDKHAVRGDTVPYEGETMYAWDPRVRKIVYWYVALPGFYSTGEAAPADGAVEFTDSLTGESGQQKLRIVWRQTSAESYKIRVEDRTGPTTRELWTMEMKRVK